MSEEALQVAEDRSERQRRKAKIYQFDCRDPIPNILWIIKKGREFHKNVYFCFIDMPKPLTVWITINLGKFFKRWEY